MTEAAGLPATELPIPPTDPLASPIVQEWRQKLLRQSKASARVYSEFLRTFYRSKIEPRGFVNIDQWVAEVRSQQDSKEIKERRAWGRDLEEFITSYVSPTTGKPYTYKTRKIVGTAIKSFLEFHLGEVEKYKFHLLSSEERLAEQKRKEEEGKPIDVEEFRKLVHSASSTRDRAILLSLASGLGLAEWLQFSKEWWKYDEQIRAREVPLQVNVIRPKTGAGYFVLLWDDALDALALLIEERDTQLGRSLKKGDSLFVNMTGGPITNHRVRRTIRILAERTGLEAKEKGRIIYRIRPHELGRDFFKTLCENNEVPDKISEFCLGHKIDSYEYNRFYATNEGKERIRKALSKLRPILNVVSGRGDTEKRETYFEQTIETLAISKGMDPEELKSKLIYYASKLPVYAEAEQKIRSQGETRPGVIPRMTGQFGFTEPERIVRSMTKEELFPAVITLAKSLAELKPVGSVDKVIDEAELETYLSDGWTFVSVVNTKHVVVRRTA